MHLLGILSLCICIPILIIFGLIALGISKSTKSIENQTISFFLTARNSQPTARIAWSFYASSIGAGALFAPVAYTVNAENGAGWLGLISYSLFTGLPIVLVAYLGILIKSQFPHALSLGDYSKRRFGPKTEFFVALIVFFNLSIAMAAEYTGIGEFFKNILGVPSWIPIVAVGSITLIYTTVGGLYVSILTDQYQAIFSLILLFILTVYVSVTFRPGPLPELPPYLALNEAGVSSIITLGLAITTSCFYSDAMWQRVWSSQDDSSLKTGAWIGASLTSLVIFLFGLAGFMATWAGYSTNANTAFFSILGKEPPLWIALIVASFAITMNESAIDSYQNAITDTIVSIGLSMGYTLSLFHARVLVLVVNIPIMLIALQGFNIASLYLVSNMITTCSTLPIMLGLFSRFDYLTGSSVLFGCFFALFNVILYATISMGSLPQGLVYYFYTSYDAIAFLIGSMTSLVGVFLWHFMVKPSNDVVLLDDDSESFDDSQSHQVDEEDSLIFIH